MAQHTADPKFDLSYDGTPAGAPAIRASRVARGRLQADASHFMVEALGLPAVANPTEIDQVLISMPSVSKLAMRPTQRSWPDHSTFISRLMPFRR